MTFIYVGIWTGGEEYYEGYLTANDKLYDKSGSVVISGYDDYYLVEEDGEKLGKFKAAYDEDERLESYLRDRDYKVHEF